jgi:hypothetical protein
MSPATTRVGGVVCTASGIPFYPLDPRPDEIRIEDIAHALSNMCRWTGHVKEFYSVAEHSVRVSWELALRHGGNAPLARAGLLHDASEAYLVDVPRPVKHLPMLSPYRDAEALLQSAIARKFGCELEDAADRVRLEVVDDVLLATEWRDLMPSSSVTWFRLDTPPLADVIRPWPPSMARAEFLDRFHHLFGAAT